MNEKEKAEECVNNLLKTFNNISELIKLNNNKNLNKIRLNLAKLIDEYIEGYYDEVSSL